MKQAILSALKNVLHAVVDLALETIEKHRGREIRWGAMDSDKFEPKLTPILCHSVL